MFIEDDKLSQDVVRKKQSDTRDALCSLEGCFESEFSSMDKDAIGRPLYATVMDDCNVDGD